MLNPEYGVGDIAKELGKKWSDADPETKSKYEAMAEKDKARYERVSKQFLFFKLHSADSKNYLFFLSIVLKKFFKHFF